MEAEVEDAMENSAIKNIMALHETKCKKMYDAMNKEFKPLHRFSHDDICNVIKHTIMSDMDYKNNLLKTMQILIQCSLSGQLILDLSMQNIRNILEESFIEFMSYATVNVIFHDLRIWKTSQDANTLEAKTAEEIGYILFNYPLNRLVDRINQKNDAINGEKYILMTQNNHNWMQEMTGYNEEEIHQINSALFKYHTLTKSEIIQNIDSNLSINKSLSHALKEHVFPKIDVERIHYQIKQGRCILKFSDLLFEQFEKQSNKDTDSANVYKCIAQSFIPQTINENKSQSSLSSLPRLDVHQNWICSQCGNDNFLKCTDSKMENEISVCILCGIQRVDSIILQLKGSNTHSMRPYGNEFVIENKEEKDIDSMIESAQQQFGIECSSVAKLAKSLIKYKRWIKALNGDDSLHRSVKVNIEKFVNDAQLKKIMMECAKKLNSISDDHIKSFEKFVDNKSVEINVQTFIGINCFQFCKIVHEHTNIQRASIKEALYYQIDCALKDYAQKQEFGSYISEINVDELDADYHFVLKNHIVTATKEHAKNIFDFYEHLLLSSECRIIHRRQEAINQSQFEEEKEQNEDSWLMNQQYLQKQLDVIYCFLVHSNSNSQRADDFVSSKAKNKKYLSDLPTKSVSFSYSHPYLSAIHSCIKNELLNNSMYKLSKSNFDQLLFKAIKKREAGMKQYREELLCKYFKREYNILRNTVIGVRHVLACCVYTDIPRFCTEFVGTYRAINDKETKEQMTQRHRQLYYYARSLFEAVEFFGLPMNSSKIIYHSLSTVRKFHKFSVNFHHPISTTTSKNIAHQFNQKIGVILALRCSKSMDPKQAPKVLYISWLSDPNDGERLYYGESVLFEIVDIIEGANSREHAHEIFVLNTFQHILQNKTVKWDQNDKDKNEMIQTLVSLINEQKNRNNESTKNEVAKNQMSEYGQSLFSYFCNHKSTTSISIRNYKSLPIELQKALLFDDKGHISLMPIARSFWFLTDISFNNLSLDDMIADSAHFVKAVLEYVNGLEHEYTLCALKKIQFQSGPQEHKKENGKLKKMSRTLFAVFSQFNWHISYSFDVASLIHSISFIKAEAPKKFSQSTNLVVSEKPKSKPNTNSLFVEVEVHSKYIEHGAIAKTPTLFDHDLEHRDSAIDHIKSSSAAWNEMPAYFMQITAIHEDVFYIELSCLQIDEKMRARFRIIDLENAEGVNESVTIYKRKKYGRTDIEIDEQHAPSYHLALYSSKNTDDPIASANKLKFDVLKNENDYPPNNKKYKPNAVDLSSLIKVLDEENERVRLFWSMPTLSIGDVSYRVNHESTDSQRIRLLPYSMPTSLIPTSFTITTVLTVDGKEYVSDKSDTIYVGDKGVYHKKTIFLAYQFEDHRVFDLLPSIHANIELNRRASVTRRNRRNSHTSKKKKHKKPSTKLKRSKSNPHDQLSSNEKKEEKRPSLRVQSVSDNIHHESKISEDLESTASSDMGLITVKSNESMDEKDENIIITVTPTSTSTTSSVDDNANYSIIHQQQNTPDTLTVPSADADNVEAVEYSDYDFGDAADYGDTSDSMVSSSSDNLESLTSDDDDGDDGVDAFINEYDGRELIEGLLDVDDVQINYKMIEILSKNEMTHLLMSYISRMPNGPKVWQETVEETKLNDVIPPTLPLSSDDPDDIKETQLSYAVLRLLSNGEDTVGSLIVRQSVIMAMHALYVFQPQSNGNKYHGRVALELLLSQSPNSFLTALANDEHIQILLKSAIFRNLHQGNMNSFVLDLFCFRPLLNENKIRPIKKKVIELFAKWQFVDFVLLVACDPRHGDDVCSNYTMFILDMMARVASSPCTETRVLFGDDFEEKVIEMFMTALLNLDKKNRSSWHRVLCGQSLLSLFDIVSRETLMAPQEMMDADESINIFYSKQKAPQKLRNFIPKMCEAIMGETDKAKPVRLSTGTISKPLGQIKLNCLELLTVCADLAEFECANVLDLLPIKFWSELLNMAILHKDNNLFLGHFRHFLQLAMIFRRRYLKHLFVNDKMLERLIEFYSKESRRSSLHGYILFLLDDFYKHDQKNFEDEKNKNYSSDKEDQWDIGEFFESNDAWNGFCDTLFAQIEIQSSENLQAPHLGIATNDEELDELLKSLLGDDLDEPLII